MAILLTDGQESVTLEKDKDARKDYYFELADILPPNDPLLSVTWGPSAGITVSDTDHNATDVVAWFSGGAQNTWGSSLATWVTVGGATGQFVVRFFIKEDAETISDLGSALFPNKFTAVANLRRDGLMVAAANHFAGIELGNQYLWSKMVAAEAEISHTLRVKFQPTTFFTTPPTQEQIDDLNGKPWEEDTAYDYDPDMFQGEMWGFIMANNSPLISVSSLRYVYPAPDLVSYEIPADWIRLDKRAGQVRIVPMSVASVPIQAYLLQLMGGGRVVPQMMHMTYVAGLTNAARDYPELVDAVKKLAMLKIIEDGFMPQSGSISADGLSQSISSDMTKYQDTIDAVLNGPKGSNGGLMTAIHGIRLGVM